MRLIAIFLRDIKKYHLTIKVFYDMIFIKRKKGIK